MSAVCEALGNAFREKKNKFILIRNQKDQNAKTIKYI